MLIPEGGSRTCCWSLALNCISLCQRFSFFQFFCLQFGQVKGTDSGRRQHQHQIGSSRRASSEKTCRSRGLPAVAPCGACPGTSRSLVHSAALPQACLGDGLHTYPSLLSVSFLVDRLRHLRHPEIPGRSPRTTSWERLNQFLSLTHPPLLIISGWDLRQDPWWSNR